MKHYEPKHIAALSDRGFYTILTVCGLIIAASAWVLWMHAGSSAETAVPETGRAGHHAGGGCSRPDRAGYSRDGGGAGERGRNACRGRRACFRAGPTPAVTVSAPVYTRPTAGAVLTPFSGDMLLFQPTLGDWRVHSGTDFACRQGRTFRR